MQKKSVDRLDRSFYVVIGDGVIAAFVIGPVTDDRVIDRRKVHADLVSTASLDLDIEQSEFFETLAHLPQRQCVTAIGRDRHFCPMPSVAGHRSVDSS